MSGYVRRFIRQRSSGGIVAQGGYRPVQTAVLIASNPLAGLITAREAARLLCLRADELTRWRLDGRIAARLINGRVYYQAAEVERLLRTVL